MGQRVLLFGGSFDPIHHGHLIIARAAAEKIGCQQVIFIPAARPPHKRNRRLANGEQRLVMCRAAVTGEPLFAVDDWEMQQSGPSYTLETVRHYRSRQPQAELFWLIGMDSLRELHLWYEIGTLVDLCTVVTALRPGDDDPDWRELAAVLSSEQVDTLRRHVLETPEIAISATDIRQRVRAGLSIRYLVPPAVDEYIASHGLYRSSAD
jgi:nicotinate-nucleotide adenylyltransferase